MVWGDTVQLGTTPEAISAMIIKKIEIYQCDYDVAHAECPYRT